MCIRHETREKVRRSLAFSSVAKPHTHITYMLRQPSMKNYVTKYCNICDSCAARKPSRSRNKAPLGKYVVKGMFRHIWPIIKEK